MQENLTKHAAREAIQITEDKEVEEQHNMTSFVKNLTYKIMQGGLKEVYGKAVKSEFLPFDMLVLFRYSLAKGADGSGAHGPIKILIQGPLFKFNKMAQQKVPTEMQISESDSDESWDENAQEEHIRRRISVRRENIRKRLAEESEHSLLLDQIEDDGSSKIEKPGSISGEKQLADVIRNRVRDKLKAVKAGIASSFVRDLPVSSHHLQQIKDEELVTRFDKALNIEWDEGNQFFTSALDESPDSVIQEHEKTPLKDLPLEFHLTGLEEEPENEVEISSSMSEEKAKFNFYINEQIIEREPAKYEHDKLWRKKNKNLFIPSTSQVAVSSKLSRNLAPRILKDEGFYVSRKPEVLKKNINKMENRFLVQKENKSWFGEDGNIIALPDPIKLPWNCRQPSSDNPEPCLETVYRKAIVSELVTDIAGNFKEISQVYQLDINIANLRFVHHPLFSREHVLAAKLIQLHDNYQQRQGKNISQLLIEKALAEWPFLGEAMFELETKRLLNVEKKKDRTLLKNILDVWKQIKSLRKFKKCICTPIKLQVQKLEVNYKTLGKQCEMEYIAEVIELEQEFEKEFKKEMEMYNEKLEIWKNKQKAKERKGTEEDDSFNEYTDDDVEEPPKLSVPTDRATIENIAKRRTALIYSQQEEPILIPKLSLSMAITSDSECSGGELHRRMEMQNHKFFISIFYNDKFVSSTVTSQLQSDFTVQFRQIFNFQIIHKPENIRLEIYELVNTKMNMLAKLYIPIPEVTMITSTAVLEEIEFSSDEIVVTNHEGVGSNTPFLLDERKSEECLLLTSGKLLYSVSWGVDENGTALAPPAPKPKTYKESMDAIASIGMSRINNLQKLANWAKKARIDPNDPQNLDLMHVIKYVTKEGQSVPKYFRLQQIQDEFNFVTDEKLEMSRRFRLLVHRNSGVPEYCCYKQVPPYEREVPEHIFEEFESQKDDIFIIMGEDSLTEQRMMALKYLEKVKASVMKRLLRVKHHFTLSDIVVECEDISTISQISLALFDVIAPRKTLKPLRKERKKIPAQTLSDGDIKLLINVIGAYNIPMRKCIARTQPLFGLMSPVSGMTSNMHYRKSEGEEDPFNQIQVQPFVEVTFQQSMYQTSIADGSQPCWNEKLEMDFKSPNGDYNSSALCKMNDKILINVFDSLTVASPENDCPETCRIKPHIKNWLGSISIPFSTILEQSKVSGTFRIDTPVMLLGYTWKKIETGSCEQFYEFGLAESSLLSIFITLDPQVSCSDNEDKQPPLWQLETIEDEEILHMAYTFQKEIHNIYPKRRVVVNIIDSECRVGIVTRYIKPLGPPQELLDVFPENPEATFNLVARFVSLIPYLPDNLGFSDACNIWLTSQQFLNLTLGGKEDHAVLLCNYFLYMKINAFVLLGTSVLEGATAYVLTQEKMNTMIWNPETGECYEQFNAFCPLQSADCLINKENIWFNIQKNSIPMSISFDITKENNWRPFFRSSQHRALSSVQPQELIYYSTERSLVVKLQNRIEWALKNKIMEWRAQRPTRWNRYCTGVFQNFLPLLEQNLGRSVSEEQSAGLESLLKEYKVSGFPIQMCYSKLETILDKVYSTGIHKTDIPNVEFAVAVYIYPYPNNVLSVWIYIASLVHDT
ncbi:protein CC2D2B-like [Pristis pectinata]|uniref:protein CC2D2B-like n=1 Tax=Pristis pectinata TaxID=685728 RepID=UPI00223E27E3|nr:protein CC2D2B-like [Pristis pectinata]